MSVISYEPCLLCVEIEVAKLISLAIDLGIEPKNREDVWNLIRISDYSSVTEDMMFIENVIDAYLEST
ncbi:MAG: hypothetical protein ACFFEF_18555 [Candidatus Thorarchaeota archaeon]